MNTPTMDVYYIGYPLYKISGPVDVLADAYENETEDFIESVTVEDIRTLDFKIHSDLWAFGYLVGVKSVDETAALISLNHYQENESEMANDLVAMAFIVIQEAPFLDTMTFIVDYEETSVAFTFSTEDVRAYMNDEIGFAELMGDAGSSSV
jgi:hypothetical protein